ncbi:MAG: hypothetical protein ABIN69_09695 [Aestuariivirga sp.]
MIDIAVYEQPTANNPNFETLHKQPILAHTDNPLTIVIESHLLRCGKQVKLVLSNDVDGERKSNAQLVQMIIQSRRWFDGLISGTYPSLSAIVKETSLDKAYVSRLTSLAFLAPDVIERILKGDHSPTLTPERLRKACPLHSNWEDQRALLLA